MTIDEERVPVARLKTLAPKGVDGYSSLNLLGICPSVVGWNVQEISHETAEARL